MKFPQLREFRPSNRTASETVSEALKYLSIDLVRTLKDLTVGLTKLSFLDNFDSFQANVTIDAGEELAIRNDLSGGLIPTQRIIVRGGIGAQNLVDGTAEWTSEFVYLRNVGGTSLTATVIFLR